MKIFSVREKPPPRAFQKYRKIPFEVLATKIDEPFQLQGDNEIFMGKPGDYLVINTKGQYSIINGPLFEGSFSLLGGEYEQ